VKNVIDKKRWLCAIALVLSFGLAPFSDGGLSRAFALSNTQSNQLQIIESDIEKEETLSPELLSSLESILESEPENYRAHILLGEYYEHLSLKDQAAAQYKLAAASAPNDAQAMINLIKLQVRAGQLQAAGVLVKEAKKRFPKDAQVDFWEGNFSFESAPNKAESAYLRAIHENEQIVGLPTALAEIRLKQRRYMEAYLLASVDISHDRKFWTAYKIKGFAAFGMGKFKESVSLLSVAFDHLNGRAKSAKGLAMAALRSGQYNIGLEPALVHLGLTSSLTETSFEQKQLVIDLWRHVPLYEARGILARTEALYGLPTNASYHFAMGDIFDKLGLESDAVQEYQRGLAIKPDFARGLYRLARDLELYYHRYSDALEDYQLASHLSPSDEEISQSLNRLESRLRARDGDLAWRFKDLLHKVPN
jgi:tetratricopeptide (TPR) repeat protein